MLVYQRVILNTSHRNQPGSISFFIGGTPGYPCTRVLTHTHIGINPVAAQFVTYQIIPVQIAHHYPRKT